MHVAVFKTETIVGSVEYIVGHFFGQPFYFPDKVNNQLVSKAFSFARTCARTINRLELS